MPYRIVNGRPHVVGTSFANEAVDKKSNQSINDDISLKSKSFDSILNEKINKESLKVSAHAMERIESLNINDKDLEKINEAFIKARDKGCENSVILYKDVAFIGSIKNNTLITAVEKERAKENVFTNIDSVIIL